MISRKMKFLSAAVAAAALIATVAVARTVHTHGVPVNQASNSKVIGTEKVPAVTIAQSQNQLLEVCVGPVPP